MKKIMYKWDNSVDEIIEIKDRKKYETCFETKEQAVYEALKMNKYHLTNKGIDNLIQNLQDEINYFEGIRKLKEEANNLGIKEDAEDIIPDEYVNNAITCLQNALKQFENIMKL